MAEAITAEWVLNATGRAPNVQDLGLEEVGVDFGPRGVKTSDREKPVFRHLGLR
jgi:pyruvate/2-oxoglutarate dehydrogenase complex dihydrolipoamide dehydrogenase (E3) component